MGKHKPSGVNAARKLRIHRRNQRWANKVSIFYLMWRLPWRACAC
jgi:hypothetical protein